MYDFGAASGNANAIKFGDLALMESPIAYTIVAWIKPADVTPTGAILTKRKFGGDAMGWYFRINGAQQLSVAHFEAAGSNNVVSNTAINDAATHMAGLSWDGANADFYLDGAPDGSPALVRAIDGTTGEVMIGNMDNAGALSDGLDGRIGQVFWWDVALTAAEMASVYAGFIPRLDHLKFGVAGIIDPDRDYVGGVAGTKVGTVTIALDSYKTWYWPFHSGQVGGFATPPVVEAEIGDIAVIEVDAPGYEPEGTVFDGGIDKYLTAADLTDVADGKEGTISFMIRIDGDDDFGRYVFSHKPTTAERFYVYRTPNNIFRVLGKNAATTTKLRLDTQGLYKASTRILRFIAAWKLDESKAYIYIDDVADYDPAIVLNDDIDYLAAGGRWAIAGYAGSDIYNFPCMLSALWFDTTFIDIVDASNRRLFFDAYGNPVDLGDDGSRPTGSRPIVYCPRGDGSDNRGYGGAFVENGSPEKDVVVPVDHTIYLCDRAVTYHDMARYEDKMLSLSNVTRGVSENDNALTRPEITVEVDDNDKRISHLIKGRYGHLLRGSAARMRLLGSGLDPWTEFTGKLNAFPQTSPHVYSLSLRQDDEPLEKKFPKTRITQFDWPNAAKEAIGQYVPYIAGIHNSVADSDEGMVPTYYVDTVGYRYMPAGGYLKAVPRVYVNGEETSTANYSITHPVVSGQQYTLIDFTGDQGTAIITADVEGYEDSGDGTGVVITNPVRQFEHALENFVYADHRSGSWLTGNSPIDDDAFAVAANFADREGYEGAIHIAGDQIKGKDFVNAWLASFDARAYWERTGELAVLFLDHAKKEFYLDGNSWVRWEQHEGGFSTRHNVDGITSRITLRYTKNTVENQLKQTIEVRDLSITEETATDLDQQYGPARIV